MASVQSIQLINDRQEFTAEGEAFTGMESIRDYGNDYVIVAVFGSQSTGKSTLLNALFGTSFQVMQDKRQQTTRGIWMSNADSRRFLVLDVEGTDSREHGDNQDFERKSALFSLSIAQVIIVNIWETSIGLYNAANLSLLRIVFAVNAQLFCHRNSPKTVLYFIIRDYQGNVSLESLVDTLKTEMTKIWEAISKPKEIEDTRLEDFFVLRFSALLHKNYQPAEFAAGVTAIRDKFYDPANPDYVLTEECKKSLPIDGFIAYAGDIWKKIMENQDLDLPGQQELVGRFRCNVIADETLAAFRGSLKPYETVNVDASVFRSEVEAIRSRCLSEFNERAGKYDKRSHADGQAHLLEQMNSEIHPLFFQHVSYWAHEIVQRAFKDLLEYVQTTETFMKQARSRKSDAEKEFAELIEHSILSDTAWDTSVSRDRFIADYDDKFQEVRESAIHTISEKERNMSHKEIISLVVATFEEQCLQMWEYMWKGFCRRTFSHAVPLYNGVCSLTADDEAACEAILNEFVRTCVDTLLGEVKCRLTQSPMRRKLREVFENAFKYDENSVPRVWSSADQIDRTFVQAKAEVTKAACVLSKIELLENDRAACISALMSTASKEEIRPLELVGKALNCNECLRGIVIEVDGETVENVQKHIKLEMESMYTEAKRSLITSKTSIPPWIILLLIAFAWNEISYMFRHPLMLFILVLIGIGLYLANAFRLLPVMRVAATQWLSRAGIHI